MRNEHIDPVFGGILNGVSPAVGEFAIGEAQRLREVNAELLEALKALVAAEDEFVEETGCDLSDSVSIGVEAARAAIAKAEAKQSPRKFLPGSDAADDPRHGQAAAINAENRGGR